MPRKLEEFQPEPADRLNFLKTVELGLPKETAAAAVGWTKKQLASLLSNDPKLKLDVDKMAARAEIKLYTVMMESGQADWRCVQSALERLHPERYAKPETQVQLAAAKIDSQAMVEGIAEWLTIAEQRHSGVTIDRDKADSPANPEVIEFKEYE